MFFKVLEMLTALETVTRRIELKLRALFERCDTLLDGLKIHSGTDMDLLRLLKDSVQKFDAKVKRIRDVLDDTLEDDGHLALLYLARSRSSDQNESDQKPPDVSEAEFILTCYQQVLKNCKVSSCVAL